MLMLRLERGIPFADFSAKTGSDARTVFADPIDRLTRLGLLEADDQGVRLTERGLDVADAVSAEFLVP
jgi:coproporphyrinogen III oxidase-like Fe-S oxidoreductase